MLHTLDGILFFWISLKYLGRSIRVSSPSRPTTCRWSCSVLAAVPDRLGVRDKAETPPSPPPPPL